MSLHKERSRRRRTYLLSLTRNYGHDLTRKGFVKWRQRAVGMSRILRRAYLLVKVCRSNLRTREQSAVKQAFHKWKAASVLIKLTVQRWLAHMKFARDTSVVAAFNKWKTACRRERSGIITCRRALMTLLSCRHRSLARFLHRWHLTVRLLAVEDRVRSAIASALVRAAPRDVPVTATVEVSGRPAARLQHVYSTDVLYSTAVSIDSSHRLRRVFFHWKQCLQRETVKLRLQSGPLSRWISTAQQQVGDVVRNAFVVPHMPGLASLSTSASSADIGKLLLSERIQLLRATLRQLSQTVEESDIHVSVFLEDPRSLHQLVGVSSLDNEDAQFLFGSGVVDSMPAQIDRQLSGTARHAVESVHVVGVSQAGPSETLSTCLEKTIESCYSTGQCTAAMSVSANDRDVELVDAASFPLVYSGSVVGIVHFCISSSFLSAPVALAVQGFDRRSSGAYDIRGTSRPLRGHTTMTNMDRVQLLSRICTEQQITIEKFSSLQMIIYALPDVFGGHLQHSRDTERLFKSWTADRLQLIGELENASSVNVDQVQELLQVRSAVVSLQDRIEHLTKSRAAAMQLTTRQDEVSSCIVFFEK
jgi:hypothetical protein